VGVQASSVGRAEMIAGFTANENGIPAAADQWGHFRLRFKA